MKRIAAISLILMSCLILSGCSYVVGYVVINKSNSPLEVEYVVTSKVDSLEHTATKPFKTTLSNWDAWFGKKEMWSEIPQNEYEFDPTTRKCRIELAPNEVLKISWQHETILKQENYDDFYVERLKLNGTSGMIIYEGKYFYKQFEKKNDQNYFLTYK